jgi:beta-lactamase regulating signal transducer with metallopeptidase domain
MGLIHIQAIELASSAVIRILAAYLLFYALTRITSRATVRHAFWLVFLAASSFYWLAAAKQMMDLQRGANLATMSVVAPLAGSLSKTVTALTIPFAWNGIVALTMVVIFWSYAAGVVAMLIRIARRRLRLRQAVSQAQPAAYELEAVFGNACAHLEVSRCQILEAPGLTSPGTAYAWNPVVIMPEGIDEYLDKEQLIDVLYHELMHVKRLDFLWSTFAEIAACLLFFHPAVWLAVRNLARERELACDMAVMELRHGRRQDYALCLTRLARRQVLGLQVEPPNHLTLLNSFLAYRVKTLLTERRRRKPVVRAMSTVVGIGTLFLFAAAWSSLGLAVELENATPRVIAAAPALVRPVARSSMRLRRQSAPPVPEGDTPQVSDNLPEPHEIAAQPAMLRYSPVDPSLDGDTSGDAESGLPTTQGKKGARAVGKDQSPSTPGHNPPSWQKSAADAAIGAVSRVAAGKRDNDGDSDDRAARPF